MRNIAPPLKRPSALASATVPAALAPAGISVWPLTVTGSATVPEKASPELLRLELRVSPRRMTMCSPAGTVAAAVIAAGFSPALLPAGRGVRAGVVPDGVALLDCDAEAPGDEVAGC